MSLQDEIDVIRERENEAVNRIENVLSGDARYQAVKVRYDERRTIFDEIKKRHGGRACNMLASKFYYIPYSFSLVFLGYVEWLINYENIDKLFGIPLLVTGVVIAMALAVAGASHVHGTIAKQFSFRFHDRRYGKKSRDFAELGMGSGFLVAALGVAAITRYVIASRDIAACGPLITGPVAQCESGFWLPIAITIIVNIIVWLIGAFLAFYAHDHDPDYMEATRDFTYAEKKFLRWRRKPERQIKAVQLQCQKEIDEVRAKYEIK